MKIRTYLFLSSKGYQIKLCLLRSLMELIIHLHVEIQDGTVEKNSSTVGPRVSSNIIEPTTVRCRCTALMSMLGSQG